MRSLFFVSMNVFNARRLIVNTDPRINRRNDALPEFDERRRLVALRLAIYRPPLSTRDYSRSHPLAQCTGTLTTAIFSLRALSLNQVKQQMPAATGSALP